MDHESSGVDALALGCFGDAGARTFQVDQCGKIKTFVRNPGAAAVRDADEPRAFLCEEPSGVNADGAEALHDDASAVEHQVAVAL